MTWHCVGVRVNHKDGSAADNEVCRAANVPANNFVAGTYRSNGTLNVNLASGSSDPNLPLYRGDACGIVAPAVPGTANTPVPGFIATTFTVVSSDFNDGHVPRCATSFTLTYLNAGPGVWYLLLNMTYRP